MKRFIGLPVVLVVVTLVFLGSCNKDNNGVNIFTVEDDMQLGLQMEQQIQGDPANYPLLDKTQYFSAYQHLGGKTGQEYVAEYLLFKNSLP